MLFQKTAYMAASVLTEALKESSTSERSLPRTPLVTRSLQATKQNQSRSKHHAKFKNTPGRYEVLFVLLEGVAVGKRQEEANDDCQLEKVNFSKETRIINTCRGYSIKPT
jgi:hypothetical protein